MSQMLKKRMHQGNAASQQIVDRHLSKSIYNGPVSFNLERPLDDMGWKILKILQQDARISFSELGRRVNLSTPAVAERVRKLEDAGLIKGYRAEVDPAKAGYPITAFIQFTVPKRSEFDALELIKTLPDVIECHHIAGNMSYLLKVHVASIQRLEVVAQLLGNYGETATLIVLSSTFVGRPIEPHPSG